MTEADVIYFYKISASVMKELKLPSTNFNEITNRGVFGNLSNISVPISRYIMSANISVPISRYLMDK